MGIIWDSATGQYFYFQGLHLASPSMARATTNLAPGITFAIAAVIGYSVLFLCFALSLFCFVFEESWAYYHFAFLDYWARTDSLQMGLFPLWAQLALLK